MNFRTTVILLVLVIAGGALVLFTPAKKEDAKTGADSTEKVDENKYLIEPKPDRETIVKFSIEKPGQPALVFERSGAKDENGLLEDWRMTAPQSTAIESYMIDGLVTSLVGQTAARTIELGKGVTEAEAGLAPPQAAFKLYDKTGKEYKIEIGKKAALSNDTYVRVGDKTHLVSREYTADLKRDVSDFRAKTVAKMLRRTPVKVEIDYDGKHYEFAKGSGDDWVINSPVKTWGKADKIKALATSLSSVRVDKFVAEKPDSQAQFGLEKPFLKITVTSEEKKKKATTQPAGSQPAEPEMETITTTNSLLVGGFADMANTKRFIKLPDEEWIAQADKTSIERLIPKLSELRDSRVTRVKLGDVTQMELTAGNQTVALKKEGIAGWKGEGELADLDLEAAKSLVSAFEDVQAIDFVDDPKNPADYGLDKPRAVLKGTIASSAEPIELRVGANTPSGRNTYVQVAGQSIVQVISVEQANRLAVTPLSLRSREIIRATPDQVTAFDVTRGDGGQSVLEKRGGAWFMLQPADTPPDAGVAREFANDLAALRAKKVVAKDDAKKYGLDKPALVINVTLTKPVSPQSAPSSESAPATQSAPATKIVKHTLRIARVNNETYLQKDDEPYVFELDESIWRVFSGELVRRNLFDFTGKVVTGLKVVSNGGTVDFTREGSEWRYVPDPTVKVVSKKLNDFAEELSKMRVESYLAYKDGDLAKAGLDQAPVTVTITATKEGKPETVTLKIDQVQAGELPRKTAWVEQKRIFLMRQADIEKLMRGLDYYTTPEAPKTPANAAEPAAGDEGELDLGGDEPQ